MYNNTFKNAANRNQFVSGAEEKTEVVEMANPNELKMIVTGQIINRKDNCRPKQLYIHKDITEWLEKNTQGPAMGALTELIKIGIEEVEKREGGPIIVGDVDGLNK